MKEIELKISGKRLIDRMKAESGKTAQIKESAGQAESMSTQAILTDDEKELVNDYIKVAINESIVIINRHLGTCSYTYEPEDSMYNLYILHVKTPENYPQGVVMSLEEVIYNTLLNRCLQQWYMLVRADDSNMCASKIQLYTQQLQETLSIRKKP